MIEIKDSYRVMYDIHLCCTCKNFYHFIGGYEGCDGFECTYKNRYVQVEPNGICDFWEKEE